MMNDMIFDALEQALTKINSGEDIEATLSKHPQVESDLRSLLETMQAAHSIASGDIPKKTINRSRTRILARAAQLRQDRKFRRTIFRRLPRLVYAFILAVIITLVSFSGLSIASAQSLPGDQLYLLKRASENIRLNLSVTLDDHYAVEDQYKARRIKEVGALLAARRPEFVEFFGEVISQSDDQWEIGGVDVHLDADTIIIGDITSGSMVEVEGKTVPSGWVQASEIHLQSYGFLGYVESISPNVWQIAGKMVHITSDSRVDSGLQVGDWVVVSVHSDDFGVLSALIIDGTNIPSPTPIPNIYPESTINPNESAPTSTLVPLKDNERLENKNEVEEGEDLVIEDSRDSEIDNHPEESGNIDDSQGDDQGESEDGDNGHESDDEGRDDSGEKGDEDGEESDNPEGEENEEDEEKDDEGDGDDEEEGGEDAKDDGEDEKVEEEEEEKNEGGN
jgi:hypothetical protein